MAKIKLSELPAAYQQSVQRQASKDLGRCNGETVKPHVPQTGAKETWFRTANVGDEIKAVEVVKVTPMWLSIVDEQGRVTDTLKEAPGEEYHAARREAVYAVRDRLQRAALDAEREYQAFCQREFSA